jgi:hypothetical protein
MSLPSASKDVRSIDLLQINYSGKVAHAIQNCLFNQQTNQCIQITLIHVASTGTR